ncbi:hypothetical protein GUITHDRAFT_141616 [Guillardia theta CCMP2712]|uniref:Uncharacterized protein n=1 Tax=Guillardia theta (strain CCMP2712) TaxID=905079 RepID=L1J156_GUITC|nr:hypothetical protein GUITHDRAFT_141616 [Guillardia theta CCMP2712]EKX41859.1 hypothetical protein GUITHDRAFT_141616 [Guillardia theta CCMP2712]|eukprot:XP_005828839.1 hypothetical protein GUITHDRAFT_141616 [Guillardia theta CCMP2712]
MATYGLIHDEEEAVLRCNPTNAELQSDADRSRRVKLFGAASAAVLLSVAVLLVALRSETSKEVVMPQYQCAPGTLANVPSMSTQPDDRQDAAITPDWTDVMTALTREVSEDTAEIAGLKATVMRLQNWKRNAEPRIRYLTHVQRWMRHQYADHFYAHTPPCADVSTAL